MSVRSARVAGGAVAFLAAALLGASMYAAATAPPTMAPAPNLPADALTEPDSDNLASALDRLKAEGIEIVWTDDLIVNCGNASMHNVGGCFRSDMPNSIIVSPRLGGRSLHFVLLHELAHVHQYRAGLPLDECAADAQAILWGASPEHAYYHCPKETP